MRSSSADIDSSDESLVKCWCTSAAAAATADAVSGEAACVASGDLFGLITTSSRVDSNSGIGDGVVSRWVWSATLHALRSADERKRNRKMLNVIMLKLSGMTLRFGSVFKTLKVNFYRIMLLQILQFSAEIISYFKLLLKKELYFLCYEM